MPAEKITFDCPRCGQRELIDISQQIIQNQSAQINWRCECGHFLQSDLERRNHKRKNVKFRGRYQYSNEVQIEPGVVAGKIVGKGKMTVTDLSLSGLKVKLKKKEDFKIDDRLLVEFHLNDYKKTFVRKNATIKNIQNRLVGGAFSRFESNSRDIGFYLLG